MQKANRWVPQVCRHAVRVGVNHRSSSTISENEKGISRRAYLDDLAANHLSYFRQTARSWGGFLPPMLYPDQLSNSSRCDPFLRLIGGDPPVLLVEGASLG